MVIYLAVYKRKIEKIIKGVAVLDVHVTVKSPCYRFSLILTVSVLLIILYNGYVIIYITIQLGLRPLSISIS